MSDGLPPSQAAPPPFATADEHLRAMLGWLHRLLAWRIAVTQHLFGALADDEYRGLYIPDSEVAVLSAGAPDLPPALAERRQTLAAERAEIEARLRASVAAGISPLGDRRCFPLLRVGQLFSLSVVERDILLLALAPEFDLRYERLYAYLQDDVTRRRPTVDLALRLFCVEPREVGAARAAFAPGAPLLRHQLVQLVEDGQRQPSLLARIVKIDDRIVNELLGQPVIDAALTPFAEISRPERSLSDLILSDDLLDRLRQTVAHPSGGLALALQGGYGSGRRAVAEALCAEAGLPLLAVDLDRLAKSDSLPAETIQRLVREADLQGAAILWMGPTPCCATR